MRGALGTLALGTLAGETEATDMWLSVAAPATSTTAEDNDTLSVPAQASFPSTDDGALLSISCHQSLAAALSPAARSVELARETRNRIDALANEVPAQTTTMHRRAPSKPSAIWPTHPHNTRPHQRSAPTFASRRPQAQLSAPEYMALVGGATLFENGAQEHRLAPRHPLRTSTSSAGLSNALKYGRGFPTPGPTPADVLESELIATSALLGEANQIMSEQRRQAQRDRIRREREFSSRAAHAAAQERARLEARAEKDKAMREMRAAREGEYHTSLGGSNLGVQRAQLLHLAEQVTKQRPPGPPRIAC